ncbi:MAG: GntR family transcriptional regulator [Alphaproteobacteria bacterium]
MGHFDIIDRLRRRLAEAQDERPLYRKLSDELEAAIGEGALVPGTFIPSERALSGELGLSRVTVRKALAELSGLGVLNRRRGSKTEVATRVEKTLSALTSFSEDIRSRGMEPGAKWLSRKVTKPSPNEIMALGISPSDPIIRLERLRLADSVPIAIERARIPQAFLPSADLVGDSLYAALEKLNAFPVRALQRMRAGVASSLDAKLLECPEATPIFIVERRCYLADGRVVEFTETRYNGEVYDFVIELTR